MPNTLTQDIVRGLLPDRPRDGHKGTFGHVLVIAGSQRYLGAARLCGMSASRSGVGLVTVGVPAGIAGTIAGASLETMTYGLGEASSVVFGPECVEGALAFAEGMSAVAMGPGFGQDAATQEFVHGFLPACAKPVVIDADGLNCLSTRMEVLKERESPTLVTPHPGEMARLSGKSTKAIQSDRETCARAFAEEYGCVVALKGAHTVVANAEGECVVNSTGNTGLASGGTGDVLTGLAGGLAAQGLDLFDVARIAVFVHALAGDLAARELSERGMTAPDVVAYLPKAWRALENGAAT